MRRRCTPEYTPWTIPASRRSSREQSPWRRKTATASWFSTSPKYMRLTGGRSLSKHLPARPSRRTDIPRSRPRFAPLRAAILSFLAISLAIPGLLAAAQNEPPPQPPAAAYHLRIANTTHGAVQISVDGGATWLLVARVARPVAAALPGAPSDAREVLRSNRYGMAF